MIVLVCGGRDYEDVSHVHRVLDEIHARRPITMVIEGGAGGADWCGWRWADTRHVYVRTVRADWERGGRAAGPRRNQRMLDDGKPDLVVAFPGGRGTADMVARARKAGVEVVDLRGESEAKP